MGKRHRNRAFNLGATRSATRKLRRILSLPRIPARPRDAHKGLFGRVLVLGGSRGMIGAPALAANAALRSGAGLVTVACPESIQRAVAILCPCATTIPLPITRQGLLDPRRTAGLLRSNGLLDGPAAPSVVAAGPGLSRGSAAFDLAWFDLLRILGKAGIPVVLDADGLNALHGSSDWPGRGWDETAHYRTVITPHPGEMARLHGSTTAAVQRDRAGFAARTAQLMSGRAADAAPPNDDHRTVVVLKGAGTIVTDGAGFYVNRTGNPGMATGGSGDVLTGIIAAFIGQGMSCLDSAVLGVHVHGLAGDLATDDLGEVSLIAADLVDYLPFAINSATGGRRRTGGRKPSRAL